MNHGSLFSGIGGFDLAAQWMGWNNVFHCEWMPFPRQVLKYHFPDSISYEDITKTDFTIHRRTIDILTGGFPCQPYSVAGKRLGKEDERHLWPEMLRAIREIEPRFVVGENVRGLVNWSGGLVFDEVQADLENAGYEVIPFIIPACAVGAPHRRDRVWFVAKNTKRNGCVFGESEQIGTKDGEQRNISARSVDGFCLSEGVIINANHQRGSDGHRQVSETNGEIPERHESTEPCDTDKWDVADTNGDRQPREKHREAGAGRTAKKSEARTSTNTQNPGQQARINGQRKKQSRGRSFTMGARQWEGFPTQSPICSGDDGLPTELDGITFSKWRNESIKGYGNAVVPQVVYEIFKAIEASTNE